MIWGYHYFWKHPYGAEKKQFKWRWMLWRNDFTAQPKAWRSFQQVSLVKTNIFFEKCINHWNQKPLKPEFKKKQNNLTWTKEITNKNPSNIIASFSKHFWRGKNDPLHLFCLPFLKNPTDICGRFEQRQSLCLVLSRDGHFSVDKCGEFGPAERFTTFSGSLGFAESLNMRRIC